MLFDCCIAGARQAFRVPYMVEWLTRQAHQYCSTCCILFSSHILATNAVRVAACPLFVGGKMDDITVLIAMVVEEDVQVPEPAPVAAAVPAAAAASENGNGNGVSTNGTALSSSNGSSNGNSTSFDGALLNGAA
jgi:hypothetical protein